MKYDENGDVIFESTGRRAYTFGEGFCCHVSDPDMVSYGSDGGIGDLNMAEKQEIAKFMIAVWKAWAKIDPSDG